MHVIQASQVLLLIHVTHQHVTSPCKHSPSNPMHSNVKPSNIKTLNHKCPKSGQHIEEKIKEPIRFSCGFAHYIKRKRIIIQNESGLCMLHHKLKKPNKMVWVLHHVTNITLTRVPRQPGSRNAQHTTQTKNTKLQPMKPYNQYAMHEQALQYSPTKKIMQLFIIHQPKQPTPLRQPKGFQNAWFLLFRKNVKHVHKLHIMIKCKHEH